MKIKKINQQGQAVIEFLLCSLVIFFFLLFYLSLCVLLISSEYMDYATFMAARTLKASYDKPDTQDSNARTVFSQYANKLSPVVRNFNVQINGEGPQAGVRVEYEADLFYLPPIFVSGAIPSRLRLSTQTRLGREPNFNVCDSSNPDSYFLKFINHFQIQGMDSLVGQMEDNGC